MNYFYTYMQKKSTCNTLWISMFAYNIYIYACIHIMTRQLYEFYINNFLRSFILIRKISQQSKWCAHGHHFSCWNTRVSYRSLVIFLYFPESSCECFFCPKELLANSTFHFSYIFHITYIIYINFKHHHMHLHLLLLSYILYIIYVIHIYICITYISTTSISTSSTSTSSPSSTSST